MHPENIKDKSTIFVSGLLNSIVVSDLQSKNIDRALTISVQSNSERFISLRFSQYENIFETFSKLCIPRIVAFVIFFAEVTLPLLFENVFKSPTIRTIRGSILSHDNSIFPLCDSSYSLLKLDANTLTPPLPIFVNGIVIELVSEYSNTISLCMGV